MSADRVDAPRNHPCLARRDGCSIGNSTQRAGLARTRWPRTVPSMVLGDSRLENACLKAALSQEKWSMASMASSKVFAETKACRKESSGIAARKRAKMEIIFLELARSSNLKLARSSNLKLANRCQEYCQKLRLTNIRRSSQRSCRISVSAAVYVAMRVDKRCTKGCLCENQYQQLVEIGIEWYRCIRTDMRVLPCLKRHATHIGQQHRVSLIE